jgi:hypothetical protein
MLEIFTTWKILGIISLIFLIIFRKGRNALWGGLTGGAIIGLISALFRQGKFDWYFVSKFAIIGTLFGIVAELLSKLGTYLKKKKRQ